MAKTVKVIGGLGDATADDVIAGKTFTSETGIKQSGNANLQLIIDAIEKKGTGPLPMPLANFEVVSTEEGNQIKYIASADSMLANSEQTEAVGVLIVGSEDGFPDTPEDGYFILDDKDLYTVLENGVVVPKEKTTLDVGLTKDVMYYYSAFPYTNTGLYDYSTRQNGNIDSSTTRHRYQCKWVGNKATIKVNVKTSEGSNMELGEYTITLLDQSSESPQNIEKTASGSKTTTFSNLDGGKSYKVQVSTIEGFTTPPISEVITLEIGKTYIVDMIYSYNNGSVIVNVNVNNSISGFELGQYTVTLIPQNSGSNVQKQGNGVGAVTFTDLPVGVQYQVNLSGTANYTPPSNGSVTTVAAQNVSVNMTYTLSLTLANLTWAQIKSIGDSGQAQALFSVGDSKTFGSYTATIAGFNVDVANSSTPSIKAPYTFTTDYLYNGQVSSDMQAMFLRNAVKRFNEDLPSDLAAVVRPIYKGEDNMMGGVSWKKYDAGFVPQAANYFGGTTLTFSPPDGFDGTDFSTNAAEVTKGQAVQYPYFSSSTRRRMSQPYLTSSPASNEYYRGYVMVDNTGYSELTVRRSFNGYARMAFCI